MIITEDLTKYFDDFVAVEGVTLNVKAGQVLALLGPNGAGKTTTVRMLTSILIPTRGKAEVAGFDVVHHPDKVRARVGVLTEHHGLYGRMNAEEYLRFYGDLYGLTAAICRQRANSLLDQFGLMEARTKRLGEYSKGMRQKLALVRALLHDPPVLLLDEPTSAMDPESARTVRDAIRGLRSDRRTIILCTHNLAEAEMLADQIAIIRRGKIILNQSPNWIKQHLLGPEEFEARLAGDSYRPLESLPEGVTLTQQGEGWLRFRVERPAIMNPVLLQSMLDRGYQVVSFANIPHSLEDAYLEAVTQHDEEIEDAG